MAIFTIPNSGGNINYFWEPLLASAVLAGPGLCELQRKLNRTPLLVTAMMFVLLLRWFLPMLRNDVNYLRQCSAEVSYYQVNKSRWESFVSVVSGRRLLSDYPELTVLSMTPEIPDTGLNYWLELRGLWNSGPVVAQIDAGVFDLIIVGKGSADKLGDFRGIPAWSDRMWSAMKRTYRPACVFDDKEIWLPRQGSWEILPRLWAIGCQAAVDKGSADGSEAQ